MDLTILQDMDLSLKPSLNETENHINIKKKKKKVCCTLLPFLGVCPICHFKLKEVSLVIIFPSVTN